MTYLSKICTCPRGYCVVGCRVGVRWVGGWIEWEFIQLIQAWAWARAKFGNKLTALTSYSLLNMTYLSKICTCPRWYWVVGCRVDVRWVGGWIEWEYNQLSQAWAWPRAEFGNKLTTLTSIIWTAKTYLSLFSLIFWFI